MKTILKTLILSSLLISTLSAVSYEAKEEAYAPKDSKSLVDFRFDFDFSNLEGDSESFDKSELSMAANTESYTAKDIEKSQAQDIYDFLNQNTSVNVLPSYGNKAAQLIDLGGFGQANGFQNIVIKINGRRINNIDRVPQLLSSISLDSIDKIEILKGAGAVANGDGATGGVINIKLKKSSGLAYKAYIGSFNTKYSQVTAGYSGKKLFLRAMTDYYDSNGNRNIVSGTEDKNAQEFINSDFSLSYKPNDNVEFLLNYIQSDIDVKYAGFLTLAQYKENPNQAGSNYTLQVYETQTYETGLNLKLSKNLTFNNSIAFDTKNSNSMSNYATPYTRLDDYKSVPFSSVLKFAAKKFEFKIGIDGFNGERENTTTYTTFTTTSKENLGIFSSYNYTHAKKHGFNIGYRSEKVSYKHVKTSGTILEDENKLNAFEAGYAYKTNIKSSLYINFNHAFLSPNIDDFFSNGAFSSFIEPQKVETTTLGYKYITKKHQFKTSLFYSRLHNEIYLNPDSYKNTNLDETQKLGFNLYNKYKITPKLSTSLNYNYVRATIMREEDNASYAGKLLPGTPPHSVTLAANYQFSKKTKINVSQNYRSDTFSSNDFANNLTQKQEAYISTDLAFSYNHSKQLKFFAKIQNLFGEDNGIWINDSGLYPVNFQTNIQMGIKGNF